MKEPLHIYSFMYFILMSNFILIFYITHAGENEAKSKNGQNQLELSKGHCNGSLCSQKR